MNIFKDGGILSKQIDNYEERKEQIRMANDMRDFLDNEHLKIFLGEGAVGIGKSMVYLLSNLIEKKGLRNDFPIVVSTSSITLQNQLVDKDLVDVKEIIKKEFDEELKFTSLKGINNYLCLEKYHKIKKIEDLGILSKEDFLDNYDGGKPEKVEYENWNKVTTTSNDCKKKKCPYYNECFYTRKKQEAKNAHIIVVNHSLLAADIHIRNISGGIANVIPDYRNLVIDEIHEFEDSCASFFTKTLSERVIKLVYSKLSDLGAGIDEEEINQSIKDKLADKLDLAINFAKQIESDKLINKINKIAKNNYRNLIKNSFDLKKKWIEPFNKLYELVQKISFINDLGKRVTPVSVNNYLNYLDDFITRLEWLDENPKEIAIWAEGKKEKPRLKLTSIDIDNFLRDFWRVPENIIMTSATIAVSGKFDFIKDRLGIDDELGIETGIYNSPFNYKKQANLIIPKFYNPKSDSFNDDVLEGITKTIDFGYDKTLILFTSYRQMNELVPKIKLKYSSSHLVLEQSRNLSKAFILNKFRNAEKSILIAQAASFGTGVDVKGDKNIILVKLNFDNPTDPLFSARSEAIEKEGGSAFMDLSIPNVSIRTKQQIGRGIRSSDDKANIAILDGRLVKSYWGRKILRTLPEMKLYKKI